MNLVKKSVAGSVTLPIQFSCITLIYQHRKKSCLSLAGLSIILLVFKAVSRQGWKHQQPEQPGLIGVEGFNSQHFSWRFASNISKCWHEFFKWDNLLPLLGQMPEQQHTDGICFQRQTKLSFIWGAVLLACLPNVISMLEQECPLGSRIWSGTFWELDSS